MFDRTYALRRAISFLTCRIGTIDFDQHGVINVCDCSLDGDRATHANAASIRSPQSGPRNPPVIAPRNSTCDHNIELHGVALSIRREPAHKGAAAGRIK
jgi:hypothetical protein